MEDLICSNLCGDLTPCPSQCCVRVSQQGRHIWGLNSLTPKSPYSGNVTFLPQFFFSPPCVNCICFHGIAALDMDSGTVRLGEESLVILFSYIF